MTSDFFAMVRRDELWVRGAVHESRLNQGQATTRGREIIGRNVIDDAALHASLREVCDSEMERVRPSIVPMREARVRAVVTATTEDFESTVAITIDGISVVTTTDRAVGDYEALKRLLRPPTAHPPHALSRSCGATARQRFSCTKRSGTRPSTGTHLCSGHAGCARATRLVTAASQISSLAKGLWPDAGNRSEMFRCCE